MKYLIFICSFTLFFHTDIKPQSNKTEIQKKTLIHRKKNLEKLRNQYGPGLKLAIKKKKAQLF